MGRLNPESESIVGILAFARGADASSLRVPHPRTSLRIGILWTTCGLILRFRHTLRITAIFQAAQGKLAKQRR